MASTSALCVSIRDVLVPFRQALRELNIPLRTGELWLRKKDPRLPPVLRSAGRRFIAADEIAKRVRISEQPAKGSLLSILDYVYAQP